MRALVPPLSVVPWPARSCPQNRTLQLLTGAERFAHPLLPTDKLRARAAHLRDAARRHLCRDLPRPPRQTSRRHPQGAVRDPSGSLARPGRPAPRFRPVTGRHPLRRPTRQRRHGSERNRYDVPARPDLGGAGPHPLAGASDRLYEQCASRGRPRAGQHRRPNRPSPPRIRSNDSCGVWRGPRSKTPRPRARHASTSSR